MEFPSGVERTDDIMARLHPFASLYYFWADYPGAIGGGRDAGNRSSPVVPSPTDSHKTAAKCDRSWGGRAHFSLGVYIIMRVFGLTQLALTVVGGTGLIGIVGSHSGKSPNNFLASIFLSMQRPFETGDLVEVSGETGYVQQLNMRTTILMTLDGNLVQIPNASVYKSNLRNFTTNPNRREDFVVGIGYDDAIDDAQEIARKVLADHPAVLNDPEPSVLADSLGRSTVNLRVYFWLNGRTHSWLKVRSSVIRLVKRAFQKHGISMPTRPERLSSRKESQSPCSMETGRCTRCYAGKTAPAARSAR